MKANRDKATNVYAVIEEIIKRVSYFYSSVPKQYQDKVFSHAYQEGHSNGYDEVYNYLLDLVNIFE